MMNHYTTKFFSALALLCMALAMQAQTFTVTAPSEVAGDYLAAPAAFGSLFTNFSGTLVSSEEEGGLTTGCTPLTNGAALMGNVALIDRGVCGFVIKAFAAEAAGAAALVICNTAGADPNAVIVAGGNDNCQLTIPAVMVSFNTCQTLRMQTGVTVSYTAPSLPPTGETFRTAIDITDGMYTVDTLTGTGGLFTGGPAAAFYRYVAASEGILEVSSCGGGADTRLIIIQGECTAAITQAGSSVDACDDGIGGNGGSLLSILVAAGQEYYILWDNAQSSSGFDFTVNLLPLPSTEVTLQVDMSFSTVSPDGVQAVYASPSATSLDDVTVLALTDQGNGIWSGIVNLMVGDTIGYAFVNGNVLAGGTVETVPAACGLAGGFGFNVRPFILQTVDPVVVSLVCFSSCGTCEVTDCAAPRIVINDDIEGYTVGPNISAQSATDHWGVWPGGTGGAVSTEQAATGSTQSIKMTGGGTQDMLLLLGNVTSGHYRVSFDMFIPTGSTGYFNGQHQAPTASAGFWGFDVFFEAGGMGNVQTYDGGPVKPFVYPQNAWFTVHLLVDLDNNEARLIVRRNTVAAWEFTNGVTNGGAPFNLLQLHSINFYPRTATEIYYIDNVRYWEIPPATEGLYCYTATEITTGTYSVANLSCFGGGYDMRSNIRGERGAWYKYTAPADGILSISSCDGAADTRGWIFTGDCRDLQVVGINDDQCAQSNGDPYATYREAMVTGGTDYYIMWDNTWEATGFDFTLGFTTDPGAPGDFCGTAIPITPGEYGIEEFTGHAAVTGPTIGTTSQGATPTAYAQTVWYAYTPTADGVMTITSCEGATTDTRVWVYTGNCATFAGLTLVANNDDGCAEQSIIEDFPVTAGTTYYIEWDNGWNSDSFLWELIGGTPQVSVTFNVDMTRETVSALGVHIAGDFQGWNPAATPMTNNGDGTWSYTTMLPVGSSVQYKFINGNAWGSDETTITAACGVDNGQGGFNRALAIGEQNIVTPDYCFNFCVTCDMVVSDDEATLAAGIRIFPNPFGEVVNVRFDLGTTADNLHIRVVDAIGREVYNQHMGRVTSDNVAIDMKGMAAGVYLVQVTDGRTQVAKTVVKQ